MMPGSQETQQLSVLLLCKPGFPCLDTISDKALIISTMTEIVKCNLALGIELMFSNSSKLFCDLSVS